MKRLLTLWICLGLMLQLAGCMSFGADTAAETTAQPVIDVAEMYQQAVSKIDAAEHQSYYICSSTETSVEDQIFRVFDQKRVSIEDIGKETMRCSIVEQMTTGSQSVSITEFYENRSGYVTLDGNGFTAPITANSFMDRFAPAVCILYENYNTVEHRTYGDYIQILFSQPSSGEAWAIPADAEFTDASGYAILDSDGNLTQTLYTVSYNLENTAVRQTTKIIHLSSTFDISLQSPGTYTPITDLDAPRLLENACGYLLQAETISSTAKTSIQCQAFSIDRDQTTDMALSGSGSDMYARLDVAISQTNQSRGSEYNSVRQTELYENGTYRISANGAPATENAAITAAEMRSYCQDMLVSDILLPAHILSAEAAEDETSIVLTFHASDVYAEAICSHICTLLYSDSELLHTLSSGYETLSLQCVLTLDKHTCLPVSFQLDYSASHLIEDIPYLLESKTEQTYQYTRTSGQ